MIKLGIDSRTAEEIFMDEIRAEKEQAMNGGMMNLQISDGSRGGPVVNMMIDTKKKMIPKQDLSRPEKSI